MKFNNVLTVSKMYIELTKPKVLLLMAVTVIAGMHLNPMASNPISITIGLIGIMMVCASGAVFNHALDQKIDEKMGRTHNRPIPTKQVTTQNAIILGLALCVSGFYILYQHINPITAWLTLASCIGYAVIYTLLLKKATSQNIVIGGLSGAMPPLLGWTAISGTIDPLPIILVMIIFTWTPPHFWALAIEKNEEYKKTGLPMLPITHGIPLTKVFIFLYTILLLAIGMLPYVINAAGTIYLIASTAANIGFIQKAYALWKDKTNELAMHVFRYSILNLFIIFIGLIIDRAMR